MKYYSQYTGTLFNELENDLFSLDKDNRWIRLAKKLPWASIEKIYNKSLSNQTKGASNKPARMVIGAMIIKHMLNLSDEETIKLIQENPYMQYFVGLEAFKTEQIFSPELLSIARKRMNENTFNEITLILAKAEEENKGGKDEKGGDNEDDGIETDEDGNKHKGVCKIDATCMEAEMQYPTDVNLLEDGSKEIDRLTQKICDAAGVCKPSTNRGESRSTYVRYIKKKAKGKKMTTNTKQRQIHLLAQDIETFFGILGKVPSTAFRTINSRDLNQLQAVQSMLGQQSQMLMEGINRCADRIVSIYQSHVRPIVRGKAKSKVEFGAKLGLCETGGFSYVDHISWDPYNESSDLKLHIEKYKERFGYYPTEVQADKIYLTKENRKLLKEMHIKCYCAPLGRPPKQTDPELVELRRKASGERNEVEGAFGMTKRIYRGNDIRAKRPDTARTWIGACFFVKNLKKILRGLLFLILRFFKQICSLKPKSAYKIEPQGIYPTLVGFGRSII